MKLEPEAFQSSLDKCASKENVLERTRLVEPREGPRYALGEEELTVSRRHTRELRDLLVRRARPGGTGRS